MNIDTNTPMNTDTNEPKDLLWDVNILLRDLDVLLGAYEPLTGDEVRRNPRLSKHREEAIEEIAAVCRQSGLEGSGVASLDDMFYSRYEARVLRGQLEKLDLVRARLDAKRLGVEAELARQASFFYELARSAARVDAGVRERMEAVEARGKRGLRRAPRTPTGCAAR